jgi:hypothetical protein
MQRTLISSLAMVAALMSVGNGAFAHDDALSTKSVAPNGGQLRMAGSYHFELVVAKDSKEAKDNPVTVYLTDHGDKKVPAAGATGTATILAAKSKITVPLAAVRRQQADRDREIRLGSPDEGRRVNHFR